MSSIINFIFKQAYKRQYTFITNYLIKFDTTIHGLIERQEIDICDQVFTEATLKKINNPMLIKLACGYFSKNNNNFKLNLKVKEEINKRKLSSQLITILLNSNSESIYKIYQDPSLQPSAHENNLYIDKLIDKVVSENNIRGIKSLSTLISNADQDLVKLSDSNIHSIFEYSASGPAIEMRKIILHNKTLFKQLLNSYQDNNDLFKKLLSHVTPDFISLLQEEHPDAFEQLKSYLDTVATKNITEEIFEKFFLIIEHPRTRALCSTTFMDKMIVRAVFFLENGKDKVNSTAAKLISNTIEYHYTEPSVAPLKRIISYLLSSANLDGLFKLKKYAQFEQAFDLNSYLVTFELAIAKNSKYAQELINHAYYSDFDSRNLGFDRKLNLLLCLIKQKKYSDIANNFSNPEFFQSCSRENYKQIIEATINSHYQTYNRRGMPFV